MMRNGSAKAVAPFALQFSRMDAEQIAMLNSYEVPAHIGAPDVKG